jgi:hypothetical protein
MAKNDWVEVLVDAGSGAAKAYEVRARKAGRRVDVRTSRSTVEVLELTRNGTVVRSARFMAPRVLAVVEHPADEEQPRPKPRPLAAPGRPEVA